MRVLIWSCSDWVKKLNIWKAKFLTFSLYRLVHVVLDFRPWDVMTKVSYLLMVRIYNLRTLEVEHYLELIWRLAKDLELPEFWKNPQGYCNLSNTNDVKGLRNKKLSFEGEICRKYDNIPVQDLSKMHLFARLNRWWIWFVQFCIIVDAPNAPNQ